MRSLLDVSRSCALALLVAAAGCEVGEAQMPAGDDDDGDGVDAGVTPGSPDAGPEPTACAVAATYGTAGALSATAAEQANQPGSQGTRKIYRLTGQLGPATTPPDLGYIELWDGYGAFAAGTVAPGTYQITGPELSVDTCGVCVYILGDFDPATGAREFYLAQAGTAQIDSIVTTFTGSATGLHFAQYDPMTNLVMPGGCTSAIDSVSFTSPVVINDGDGGGGGGGGGDGGGGGA